MPGQTVQHNLAHHGRDGDQVLQALLDVDLSKQHMGHQGRHIYNFEKTSGPCPSTEPHSYTFHHVNGEVNVSSDGHPSNTNSRMLLLLLFPSLSEFIHQKDLVRIYTHIYI